MDRSLGSLHANQNQQLIQTPRRNGEKQVAKKATRMYLSGAVKRTHVTKDPLSKATLVSMTRHDLVSGLVVDRLLGDGHLKSTNEPFITLEGLYGPSPEQSVRITAIGRKNVMAIKRLLLPKKPPQTLTVVGTPISKKGLGSALIIDELYFDGKGYKPIIMSSNTNPLDAGETKPTSKTSSGRKPERSQAVKR